MSLANTTTYLVQQFDGQKKLVLIVWLQQRNRNPENPSQHVCLSLRVQWVVSKMKTLHTGTAKLERTNKKLYRFAALGFACRQVYSCPETVTDCKYFPCTKKSTFAKINPFAFWSHQHCSLQLYHFTSMLALTHLFVHNAFLKWNHQF